MFKKIERIEIFVFERARNASYLGDLGNGEFALGEHHIVRLFNGTVYPRMDRSVVLRLVDSDGAEGWGETYGLVAPGIVAELVRDLLGPYLKMLDPARPDEIWDKLYELQRVRGYWGGYLADTLAALDIALWDLYARSRGESLQSALGHSGAGELPAYVSGLPESTKAGRLALARDWQARGFDRLKIPVSHTDNGDVAAEFDSLRTGLGEQQHIALDLHWTCTADEAIALAATLTPHDPWFIEAPVAAEDIDAQLAVGEGIACPLALGEEWRTSWDYRPRRRAAKIVQPEMGHTGVTQFMRIASMASEQGAAVMPHATIGLGIFANASFRAALAVGAEAHEFQHTIYPANASLLDGAASCEQGRFAIPDTPGHGVRPNTDGMAHLTPMMTL
ncbi:mandelate racemase/muconate lactonizing enzyme family protein [Granulosicoccus sp. 3-233]|uniref:mandelate racemase/muconate lactonizing enzyme family protein n=1 Tax=Granulosicoccus sp. 3-233 TaxID=3417969 RepID=UPI003D336819